MIPSLCSFAFILLLSTATLAATLPDTSRRAPDVTIRQEQNTKSTDSQTQDTSGAGVSITPDMLISINSNTTSCDATAPFAFECRNANQSASLINQAFADYNISSTGERAALLGLMMFETGGFKFDRNHFPAPGNPGQGTRNIMSFRHVLNYTLSIPYLADMARELLLDFNISDSTFDADTVPVNYTAAVLELVREDRLSFASAAWFYDTQPGCRSNQTLAEGLQNNTKEGWQDFMQYCVWTKATSERGYVWGKTFSALTAASS